MARMKTSDLGNNSLIISILLALSLATSVAAGSASLAQQTHYEWADEFRYNTLSDFVNAGWSLLGYNDLISFPGNGIQLDNDGSRGITILHSGFPISIHDWKAETAAEWVGRNFGSIHIEVNTTTHTYNWGGDGFYPEFVLYRDGIKILRFAGYQPQEGSPMTFAMEMKGNILSLFFNGIKQNSYTELDSSGELTAIVLHSGWVSTIVYNIVQVTGLSEQQTVEIAKSESHTQQLTTVSITANGATSTFIGVLVVTQKPENDFLSQAGIVGGLVVGTVTAVGTVALLYFQLRRRKENEILSVREQLKVYAQLNEIVSNAHKKSPRLGLHSISVSGLMRESIQAIIEEKRYLIEDSTVEAWNRVRPGKLAPTGKTVFDLASFKAFQVDVKNHYDFLKKQFRL